MLNSLRNKLSGWPSIVVLGVCVFAVSFFGIESYFMSHVDTFVAKVGDHEISQQDFQARVNDLRQQAMQQQGEQFDSSYFERPEVKRQVLDSMVSQQVLQQANTDLGLVVPNEVVRDSIASQPSFQVNGQFNPDAYRAILAGQGMTPGLFESRVRSDLAIQLLPEAITASTLVTDADLDRYLKLRFQQRDLRYAVLPRPALTDATVADADIDAYYKSHVADFMTPEQVSVQYLEVDGSKLQVAEQPDEKTLRDQYEKQKQLYVQPEQREVSHILVNVPKNATPEQQKAALDKATRLAAEATPENFAKLAEANSDDLGSRRQGGDLGWLEKGVANAAFDNALFSMNKGEISKPVLSPDEGYHILWLRDARSGSAKPFEEVRTAIAADWQKNERVRLYNEEAGKLADAADKNAGSLEPVAKELNLPLLTEQAFGRTGGQGLAGNAKFITAAFSDDVLAQGNNSALIEVEPTHAVVIHLLKHTAAAPKTLADVRDTVRQRILDERADAQAKKHADELLAELQKGGDFAAIAAQANSQLKTVALERGKPDPTTPQPILVQAFLLPHPADGKPAWATVPMESGSYALVAVDKVTDGDTTKIPTDQRQALRGQMADAMGTGATMEFIEALKKKTKIQIAADRL
jgi:peptidyl-prolyl cis-trans isomerase D